VYKVFVMTTRLFEFVASKVVVERALLVDKLLIVDATGAGRIALLGAVDGVTWTADWATEELTGIAGLRSAVVGFALCETGLG